MPLTSQRVIDKPAQALGRKCAAQEDLAFFQTLMTSGERCRSTV
jgi:hypothetical protein